MSVDVKTTYLQAPALAHRKPVPGGLVLPAVGWHSKTSASHHSQHPDGCGRRPTIDVAACEAVKNTAKRTVPAESLHQIAIAAVPSTTTA